MQPLPKVSAAPLRGPNLLLPCAAATLSVPVPDWPLFGEPEARAALTLDIRSALRLADGDGAWQKLADDGKLDPGSYFARLIALTALGLQQRIGRKVSRFCGIFHAQSETPLAAWEYFFANEGVASGRRAVTLIDGVARAEDAEARRALAEAEVAAMREVLPDPVADVIMEGLTARNLPWRVFDRHWPTFEVGYGCRRQRLMTSMPDSQGHVNRMVFRNKFASAAILREAGLPVPEHELVASAEQAQAAAKRIGFPLVVKPVDSGRSRGVTVNITDAKAIPEAYAFARQHGSAVLVERFIPGLPYRILILEGEVIAAARRGIPSVTGDGKQSVRQLIEGENARREEENLSLSQPLPMINVAAFAEECERRLADQKLDLDAVPKAGQEVWLAFHAQRGRGGLNVDVTAEMHPDHLHLAKQIARIMRCPMIGIDFITPDIRKSFRDVPSGINEVNIEPALNLHMRMTRTPRDVVAPLLASRFPQGNDGRVPIVAVHGGEAAPLGVLRRALAAGGLRAGFASRDGEAWIGAKRLELTGRAEQRIDSLLYDPRAEAMLLELSVPDFNLGLPFDLCDVYLVPPPLPERLGEGLRARAQLLNGMTRGTLVLPLEGFAAWREGVGMPETPCVFFAAEPPAELVAAAAAAGHRVCAMAKDGAGYLGLYHGDLFDRFTDTAVAEKPALQIEAAMAAAALLGLGWSSPEVRRCIDEALAGQVREAAT